MKTTAPLAWLLFKGGRREGRLSSAMTIAAVAVVTLILLFSVAGNFAFADRGDSTRWRYPAEDRDGPALIAEYPDYVGGTAIHRIDLAAEDASTMESPPGLDAFPRPGEVYVSPAAADLLEQFPDEQLADRYGEVTGTIGDDALTGPGELLVVVGRSYDGTAMTANRDMFGEPTARPFGSFAEGGTASEYKMYRALMGLATVFMLVPVLIFGAAIARLSVARKDRRLASMRLMGATPGQVRGITALETSMLALVGSAVGAAAWSALAPLLTRIEIDGTTWFAGDLWMGALPLLGCVLAVPLLVAISAVVGLRRTVVSPLGVAQRQRNPRLKWVRPVAFVALAALFLGAVRYYPDPTVESSIVLLLALGSFVGALSLLGPWLIQLIGFLTGLAARRPSTLLAGRRLASDPRNAWRTVSGITLVGFVAGFVAVMPMTQTAPEQTGAATLRVWTTPEVAAQAAEKADDIVGVEEAEAHEDGTVRMRFAPGTDLDAARTDMGALVPGSAPTTGRDAVVVMNRQAVSVQTGAIVVLAVTFALAIVSAAIAGVSSTLERKEVYHLLHLTGTPRKVLNRARTQEVLLPLALLGGGSILTGVLLAAPTAKYAPPNATGDMEWILAVAAAVGFAGVMLASAAARPVLTQAMRTANVQGD
ncbi:FtsX-like permease family protein [Salininema proteolyticum]|uniref:FtsX-like permease family protein n=1 Tax=Salininema proteolyticum TaxID=1607685 RepID=A0ABV8U1I8_9ACTN